MSNYWVGEIYGKIIAEVVRTSNTDFELKGVSQSTLQDLQQQWQCKLSQRNVAHMPWEPRAQASPKPPVPSPSGNAHRRNGTNLPAPPYSNFEASSSSNVSSNRIKVEQPTQQQYRGRSNEYSPQAPAPQGGLAQGGMLRAQQLVQQQYGTAANASLNAMQQRGGLALPGQQQPKTQNLQSPHPIQLAPQQLHPMQQQRAQQQGQPRIKVESNSPSLSHSQYQHPPVNYSQTDGTDDDALGQWQSMLSQRRAAHAARGREADTMMRDLVIAGSQELESGLMMPLNQLPAKKQRRQRVEAPSTSNTMPAPMDGSKIPQLDGEMGTESATDRKEEADEDAINSDLDDSDDNGPDQMGDDDDDGGDTILCTYDKVQRVKNKWKCTLKDGVMSAQGKEYVFLKGMGEFEW